MTGVSLLHDPEGNRNPYDYGPWSREPLEPTESEMFRVGVKSTGDVRAVSLQWRSPTLSGSLDLVNVGDVWSGELGPSALALEYRFVASSAADAEIVTEWFHVGITRCQTVRFTGVESTGGKLSIVGDGAELILRPHGDTIMWELDASPHRSDGSAFGEVSGWTAAITNRGVMISRGGDAILIGIERATVDGSTTAWSLTWGLHDGEQIFGTGERFDSFDQRGKTPDVRVYEEYKQQGERTYLPVPWVLSTRGYGLAIDGSSRVQFDLGVTDAARASATIPTQANATGTMYFGTPKDIIRKYVADVGLPSAMPTWAYGPWMSGNEWNSDHRVREVISRTEEEGIPATVIVIEAWSDEATFYLFNDAVYDTVPGVDAIEFESIQHGGKWPDPKELVAWLHDRGVRVLLWQIPVLKDTDDHSQQLADLEHVEEEGLAVGTANEGTYRNRGWWFPKGRVIDFTNPQARRWWFNKRAYLLDDIGIDGFKTDGGEHLWGTDVVTFGGTTGHEAANEYPNEYLGAYHEFMSAHGHEIPLTFSRAGFTGSQRYPAHWAGDEDSTWEALRASLTAGLSASVSGITFWGWDLAGFSKDLPSADLYKRSSAMAAFMPIMQYHSEHNEHRLPLADRTPWNVANHTDDDDVTSVYRFYARLRMNLVPYLLTLGTEAVNTGLPMMRPLAIEYPNDHEAASIDDQFLLGSDVLVAPIRTPDTDRRSVYVPEGEWWDLWSGERIESGWSTVLCPPETIPVYIRGGACIPLWMPDEIGLGASVGLPGEGVGRSVVMVFPGTARRAIVDPITLDLWTVAVSTDGSDLTISTDGAPDDVTVWIRGSSRTEATQSVQLPAGTAETLVRLDRI